MTKTTKNVSFSARCSAALFLFSDSVSSAQLLGGCNDTTPCGEGFFCSLDGVSGAASSCEEYPACRGYIENSQSSFSFDQYSKDRKPERMQCRDTDKPLGPVEYRESSCCTGVARDDIVGVLGVALGSVGFHVNPPAEASVACLAHADALNTVLCDPRQGKYISDDDEATDAQNILATGAQVLRLCRSSCNAIHAACRHFSSEYPDGTSLCNGLWDPCGLSKVLPATKSYPCEEGLSIDVVDGTDCLSIITPNQSTVDAYTSGDIPVACGESPFYFPPFGFPVSAPRDDDFFPPSNNFFPSPSYDYDDYTSDNDSAGAYIGISVLLLVIAIIVALGLSNKQETGDTASVLPQTSVQAAVTPAHLLPPTTFSQNKNQSVPEQLKAPSPQMIFPVRTLEQLKAAAASTSASAASTAAPSAETIAPVALTPPVEPPTTVVPTATVVSIVPTAPPCTPTAPIDPTASVPPVAPTGHVAPVAPPVAAPASATHPSLAVYIEEGNNSHDRTGAVREWFSTHPRPDVAAALSPGDVASALSAVTFSLDQKAAAEEIARGMDGVRPGSVTCDHVVAAMGACGYQGDDVAKAMAPFVGDAENRETVLVAVKFSFAKREIEKLFER